MFHPLGVDSLSVATVANLQVGETIKGGLFFTGVFRLFAGALF